MMIAKLLRWMLARVEAPTVLPLPPLPPFSDHSCEGCRVALAKVNFGGHKAAICTACGAWWCNTEHAYFFVANPESNMFLRH